jgi:hypothetical protein
VGVGLGAIAKVVGGIGVGLVLGLIFPEPAGDPPFSRKQYKTPQETPDSKGNPPFKGGQCNGVIYLCDFIVTSTNTNGSTFNSFPGGGAQGPISFIGIVIENNNYVFKIIGKSIHSFPITAVSPTVASVVITGERTPMRRSDNQPDVCGDPPPIGVGYGKEPGGSFAPPFYNENGSGIPRAVGGLGDSDGSPRGFLPTPPPPPSSSSSTGSSSTGTSSTGSSSSSSTGSSSTGTSSTGSSSSSGSGSSGTSSSEKIVQTPRGFIIPSPPPPSSIPQAPPTPERTREKDPDKVPVPPPYKEIVSPPPPPANPNADVEKGINDLKQQSNENKQLLLGLPALVPPALVSNQAFQDSVKNSSKAGTCEASAPDGCVDNAVRRNTDPIGQKVDAGNAVRDANDAAQSGALASLLSQLASFRSWVEAAFNNTVVDKVLNLLNLITNIHNAAMLSTSIKDTLAEAISLGLATVGIKTPEGSPIDINAAINSSIENLLKGVLGVEQYTALKESWAKSNRIIQSGAAVINTARSLYDSARSLNELTGNNVGKIGNALKRDGVVSENAYKVMSENNSQVNTRMEKLQNLENTVSTLASITSETYSITENVAEITKQRADFEKNVKDLEPKTQIENVPLKAKETAEKAVSVAPTIPLTELYKPDI